MSWKNSPQTCMQCSNQLQYIPMTPTKYCMHLWCTKCCFVHLWWCPNILHAPMRPQTTACTYDASQNAACAYDSQNAACTHRCSNVATRACDAQKYSYMHLWWCTYATCTYNKPICAASTHDAPQYAIAHAYYAPQLLQHVPMTPKMPHATIVAQKMSLHMAKKKKKKRLHISITPQTVACIILKKCPPKMLLHEHAMF